MRGGSWARRRSLRSRAHDDVATTCLISSVLVRGVLRYDSRLWNQKYSMRAYEVDKDGDSVVYITVPHDSDALESQGAYRMIPMKTVYGEATSPPFDVDDDDSA